MQQALNAQLNAEVELSLATSRRLADEQAITREKYKQIESGLQQASGNRQEVVSEIDDRMQELYAEMNGQYSARYKRGASNYYNALLELKNHQDDLDWLETVGSSPLMPSSDESYGEYQSFYERLLALAQQEKDWVEQQKSLAEELIGSSAQSLADSWVEAFRKGEEATWDFAKNFEDVMRQAIINGFSDSVILAQIDPIFNKFREKVMDFLAGEIDLDEVVTPELEAQIEQTAEKIKELSPELQLHPRKTGPGGGQFECADAFRRDKRGERTDCFAGGRADERHPHQSDKIDGNPFRQPVRSGGHRIQYALQPLSGEYRPEVGNAALQRFAPGGRAGVRKNELFFSGDCLVV